MTWPNVITLGRLLATPFIVQLILKNNYFWAFWVTLGAGLSDILDGFVARLFKMPSTLGAYLDPIADKVLLTALYIVFTIQHEIPLWVVFIIVGRDLLILGGIAFLWKNRKKIQIHPSFISKINTFLQILTSIFILANKAYGLEAQTMVEILLGFTIVATFLSAYGYIKTGWALLKGEKFHVC